jgi:hypothetical protein
LEEWNDGTLEYWVETTGRYGKKKAIIFVLDSRF